MSQIQEYFSSKTVLLTGATGFLGGVLLERLLTSCPQISEVYIVARPRNGQSPAERLHALLSLPLFEKVGEESKKKVSMFPGDVSLPDLGLGPGDLARMKERVEVVFHVAAIVNFSAALDKAVLTNVGGTAAVLALAKEMENLQALIHVSTAYCNCTREVFVEDKVYGNLWDPVDVLKAVQETPAAEINQRTKEYLGNHPNTYSFTKQLAENLLADERGDLPVAIVRPSIVLNTAQRPLQGWTFNVQSGAFAFIAGAGRGAFRTLRADGGALADLVPADYFAAFLIAAAWRTAVRGGFQVYHYTSGTTSPIIWSDYVSAVMKHVEDYPTENAVLQPKAKCRRGRLHNWFVVALFHFLPAFVIDLFGLALDAPSKVLEIQKKYARGMEYASYFTCNQWYFFTGNTMKLWKELREEDKNEFWFNIENFDWDNYIRICVLGVRQYYHRQDNSKLKMARSRHTKRKVYYYTEWIIFYLLMVYFLHFFISPSSSLVYSLVFVLFLFWI